MIENKNERIQVLEAEMQFLDNNMDPIQTLD